MNSLRENLSEIEATDSVVLGVSLDSIETHRRFRESLNLDFCLLADVAGEVSSVYSGIMAQFNASNRVTFIIDKAGYIRSIDDKVNVKTHGEDVVAMLKQVLPKVAVGHPAPDFIATDGEGKTHQLREFRGKKNVVLAFYPRDFGRG